VLFQSSSIKEAMLRRAKLRKRSMLFQSSSLKEDNSMGYVVANPHDNNKIIYIYTQCFIY
jgi:hypothetical protein